MNDISAKDKYKKGLQLLQNAFNTGNYSLLGDSAELFEEAIIIDSEYTEAYFCLAYICDILDKKTSTEALIRKVLEIEPFNLKAQKMLKNILSDENNYQDEKIIRQEDFLSNIMKYSDELKK